MDWHAECRRIHQTAVGERCNPASTLRVIPFSLFSYIHPEVPPAVLVLANGVSDEDRDRLRILSLRIYRPMKLHAAIVCSDSHFVELPTVAAHMGIDPGLPDEKKLEEYQRILEEKYDGTQANLPVNWQSHCLLTSLKGPQIKPFSLFTEYRFKPEGGAEVVRERDEWDHINNVLPDWWDVTVH